MRHARGDLVGLRGCDPADDGKLQYSVARCVFCSAISKFTAAAVWLLEAQVCVLSSVSKTKYLKR